MEANKEKFLKLVEEYKAKREKERLEHPENFKHKYPYELFGVECGEGWKPLYQPILDYAMEHNIEVHQVKEKFGGLRIYLASYDSTVRKMIDDAEEKSYNTCEICTEYSTDEANQHCLNCTYRQVNNRESLDISRM